MILASTSSSGVSPFSSRNAMPRAVWAKASGFVRCKILNARWSSMSARRSSRVRGGCVPAAVGANLLVGSCSSFGVVGPWPSMR
jgi:hypothetical protein